MLIRSIAIIGRAQHEMQDGNDSMLYSRIDACAFTNCFETVFYDAMLATKA